MTRFAILAPALLLVAACGGSDGGSPSAPTPTPSGPNTAPSFTSSAAISVAENISQALQATATDAQNDPVIITISGGADAALLAIDATGRITFRTAPNFEAPGDANGDNIYEVTLTAGDGRLTANQDVRITVTNSREGIAVSRIATGFSQPVQLVDAGFAIPNFAYVAQKDGRIFLLDLTTGASSLVLTVGDISTDGERGLIGLTNNVGHMDGGYALYALVTAADGTIEVRQYRPNGLSGQFTGTVTPTILASIPHPGRNNHNGGWIAFGPDHHLYVGTGDGGGSGDPDNNAQNFSSRLGKILRLARNSGGNWIAAPGNPFSAGGGDPYVFAAGLRNPFRGSFDGDMLFIGDVGENAVEEINQIMISQAGSNFGWPYREGLQAFRSSAPANLISPVLQYRHGAGPFNGASVIGGRVYRGSISGIKDHYVFADFVSGNIWSVPFARLTTAQPLDGTGFENRKLDFTPDAGMINQPVSFDVDRSDNLYIVDFGGSIYKVVPAS